MLGRQWRPSAAACGATSLLPLAATLQRRAPTTALHSDAGELELCAFSVLHTITVVPEMELRWVPCAASGGSYTLHK